MQEFALATPGETCFNAAARRYGRRDAGSIDKVGDGR
jgi:hypothetical protein